MVRLAPPAGPVVDTCGTGGDGGGTFNISTAAALVVAGCGVTVVKHGNRAVSSRSGSADVLRELGVPIETGPGWAQGCLDRLGFGFCFAPHFHPGMARVAPLRRQLGVRTIFNLLGPLGNPAGAEYQLLGVGRPELLDTLAGAAARLGTRRAVVVCSRDGLDEVSLSAPTMVRVVEAGAVRAAEWAPADFGLGEVPLAALRADGPGRKCRPHPPGVGRGRRAGRPGRTRERGGRPVGGRDRPFLAGRGRAGDRGDSGRIGPAGTRRTCRGRIATPLAG